MDAANYGYAIDDYVGGSSSADGFLVLLVFAILLFFACKHHLSEDTRFSLGFLLINGVGTVLWHFVPGFMAISGTTLVLGWLFFPRNLIEKLTLRRDREAIRLAEIKMRKRLRAEWDERINHEINQSAISRKARATSNTAELNS